MWVGLLKEIYSFQIPYRKKKLDFLKYDKHLLTFKLFLEFILYFLSSGGNFIESGNLIFPFKSKV